MSVELCLHSTPVRQSYLAKHAKPPKYSPSPLRPDVSAPDCLVHWLMPFGISYMNGQTAHFPPEVIACERFVISHSVSNNTLSNYAASLLCFTNFCDDFNILEDNQMPATESLLCIFITTHGAGKVRKGTLLSWLFGLELWHTINGAPWLGKSRLAHAVKGATSFAPAACFHPPCLPVTIQHLQALQDNLDHTNTFDAAVWAVACIAFWCYALNPGTGPDVRGMARR